MPVWILIGTTNKTCLSCVDWCEIRRHLHLVRRVYGYSLGRKTKHVCHVWTGVKYGDMFTLHVGHVWNGVKYGDMFTLHIGHVWTGVKYGDMFTLHIGHV